MTEMIAYLAGVLHGDGFLTVEKNSRGYLGLRVADRDFADAFSSCLHAAYGVVAPVRLDERGYNLVRTYNGYGRFDQLRAYDPANNHERGRWLRGLFDSEGNAYCARSVTLGPRSWQRRVTFFSTNVGTLQRAIGFLEILGVRAKIVPWRHGTGHKGTLPVHAIILAAGKLNFETFLAAVGSSIARKREAIERMISTYQPWAARGVRT
jgi:hypothetical protein